jgi:hypothetical protein
LKTYIFDRVTVRGQDGRRRNYSAQEFLALPIHERIGYILAREVEFFHGDAPIERGLALRALRE